MGGYQNYGPLLGRLNTRCRVTVRTQKGTMLLTATPMRIVETKIPLTFEVQANPNKVQ